MLVAPDFLIAVLAAWLGVSVITRTPREYAARVFAWATLLLTLYGTARMVGGLTSSESVIRGAVRVEYAVNSLLPAALLHITLALTGGRTAVGRRAMLVVAYAAGATAATVFALTGVRGLSTAATGPTFFGLPEALLAWAWVAFRALVMGVASWCAWSAWRAAPRGTARKDQLAAVLAAVLMGAFGGVLTIAGSQSGSPEWPGLALVALSMVFAAYAVLGRQLFLSRETARRSLYSSLSAALATAGYVGVLLGLERLSRQVLHVEAPLVTALALVLTIVLFDPARERLRELLDRGPARREIAYRRLLRVMGDELMTSPRPEEAIAPALAQLCTALGVSAASVVTDDGRTLATFGPDLMHDAAASVRLAVRAGGSDYGQLTCSPRHSGAPYTPSEIELLHDATGFIGASLHLAERQKAEAAALEGLVQEQAALLAHEASLAAALSEQAARPVASAGLRVLALGPLRVERDGEAIRQWGGPKAGTRQAQAVFAFLYDRGEHGVMKDEFVEVIWPDVPLEKADLAFHRTLGGLRRIIEPDLRRGSDATAIAFRNDRYYLDTSLIQWSDVDAFQKRIAEAGTSPDPIAVLEEARALYRGDYLLDCPFYGDSTYVQERRALLRGRFVDVLLALGERYEAKDDRPAAAACFREALQVSGDDCPRADDGLARLGLPLLEH